MTSSPTIRGFYFFIRPESRERKESNLFEWRRYLQILDMLKDDRSQPYIAKKLGFKNASSIANILNRFQGLETLISEHTAVVERESRIDENNQALADFHPYYLILKGKQERLTEVGEMHLKALTDRYKFHNDRLKELNSKGKE